MIMDESPFFAQHFLMTRFNVRVPGWGRSKNGQPVLDHKWIDHRFQLFDTFCFPSVLGQSNQKFTWLVFFDTSTPKEYLPRIERYKEASAIFFPHFVDGSKWFRTPVRELVGQLTKPEYKFILTTRLDNDDAIHQNFIQKIQDEAIPEHLTLIEPRFGFKSNPKGEIIKERKKFGPFISLVEEVDHFETVLARKHREWKNTKNVRVIKDRMWIQVIHERNMKNIFRKNIFNGARVDPKDFNIGNLQQTF